MQILVTKGSAVLEGAGVEFPTFYGLALSSLKHSGTVPACDQSYSAVVYFSKKMQTLTVSVRGFGYDRFA